MLTLGCNKWRLRGCIPNCVCYRPPYACMSMGVCVRFAHVCVSSSLVCRYVMSVWRFVCVADWYYICVCLAGLIIGVLCPCTSVVMIETWQIQWLRFFIAYVNSYPASYIRSIIWVFRSIAWHACIEGSESKNDRNSRPYGKATTNWDVCSVFTCT